MFIYIVFAILAALIQIATIYSLRVGLLKSFLFAIPFILLHQYLFTYNYIKAPNFTIIWFISTAIAATLSFLAGQIFFKDILNVYQVVGIVFVLVGLVLMRI